jgi:hypothetical protein
LKSQNIKIEIYRTIVFHVVLDGYETWSPSVGRTQAQVCKNWVLRKMFKPQWEEVRGDWGKWHNEEVHD